MKKLFSFNMVTIDGFFEGLNHDIYWHNVDKEFNEYAIAQLNEIGTLLFGRVTYQMMAGYWTTPDATKNDPVVAGLMNSLPKVVFSRTLKAAEWNNTRLVRNEIGNEILQLKKQPGKDLAVFGSADLLATLVEMDLVDEHRLMVNPMVLGAGTPLFKTNDKYNFKLLNTRTFRNGNVLLCYAANRK